MVTPKTWLPASCLSSVQLKIARVSLLLGRLQATPGACLRDAEGVGLLGCSRPGARPGRPAEAGPAFLVHRAALSPDLCPHRVLLGCRPTVQVLGPRSWQIPGLHARGAWPHWAAWFSCSPGQWFLLSGGFASLGTRPASWGSSSVHTHLGFHNVRCHALAAPPLRRLLCAGPAAVWWRLPSSYSLFSGKCVSAAGLGPAQVALMGSSDC